MSLIYITFDMESNDNGWGNICVHYNEHSRMLQAYNL